MEARTYIRREFLGLARRCRQRMRAGFFRRSGHFGFPAPLTGRAAILAADYGLPRLCHVRRRLRHDRQNAAWNGNADWRLWNRLAALPPHLSGVRQFTDVHPQAVRGCTSKRLGSVHPSGSGVYTQEPRGCTPSGAWVYTCRTQGCVNPRAADLKRMRAAVLDSRVLPAENRFVATRMPSGENHI